MRREGYELQVSQPEVIVHREGSKVMEPYEELTIQVPETYQGTVIEELGKRRGNAALCVSFTLMPARVRCIWNTTFRRAVSWGSKTSC